MGRPDWESEYVDFFVARAPALRRTAYLMCGDWQIAEDLVQTTFVRLYVHWRRVRQETVDAYARRILTNLFLSRRRTAHREQVTAELPELPGGHDTPQEVGGWLELADVLSALTDRQRAIVALRYVDDLPVAEVAELLGIAEGTVKSHSNRALQALRTALEAQLERPTR
ncbi:SigE family RNA polymerase sigma factor [Kribbella deserti]|uniref:SigE family RNA polymerase sigma factor n=1 Tax=Kribbella deserti TaxID=1926257 RepID=A0ABV6QLI1_9ACTN